MSRNQNIQKEVSLNVKTNINILKLDTETLIGKKKKTVFLLTFKFLPMKWNPFCRSTGWWGWWKYTHVQEQEVPKNHGFK